MSVQFIKEAFAVLEITTLYLTPEGRIQGTTNDKSIVVESLPSGLIQSDTQNFDVEVLRGEENFIRIFATHNGNDTCLKAEIQLKPTYYNMIQRSLIQFSGVGSAEKGNLSVAKLRVEVDHLSQLGDMRYGYISELSIAT